METRKLKNIAILILLVTNLCLLFFAVRRTYQEASLRERALDDAVRLLASQGILVNRDAVPDAGQLAPQTVPRSLELEAAAAAQLLGESVRSETTGVEVYRYSSSKGYLQFHSSGAFSGEFEPGAFPAGEDPEESCRTLLARLNLEADLQERDADSCTFLQRWSEVPLFSQQITVTMENGSLTALSARQLLAGEGTPDAGRSTITTPTALIQFLNGVNALGDVCSRVDEIIPGYYGTVPLSGPMALTPVWHITTDTGGYRLDLVTGELSRAVTEGSAEP